MVVLPDGFEAVSEAERIDKKVIEGNAAFTFHFPYPLREISLVASKRYKVSRGRAGSVDILTYFFAEDEQLASNYIEQTKKYLKLYEVLSDHFRTKDFPSSRIPFPQGIQCHLHPAGPECCTAPFHYRDIARPRDRAPVVRGRRGG